MILPVVTVFESFLNWFSRHLKTKLKDSFNFCNWPLTILEIAKLSIKFLLKTTFKSKVQVLKLFLGVHRWEDIVPFIKQFESLGDDLTAGPGVQQWNSKKNASSFDGGVYGTWLDMYPLVNVYIANWNITMLLMGKSTISMAIFNSYVTIITRGYIHQYPSIFIPSLFHDHPIIKPY